MTADAPAVTMRPQFCEVSASPDRTELALTFATASDPAMRIVLPVAGVAELQRNLARSLLMLGMQHAPSAPAAAAA